MCSNLVAPALPRVLPQSRIVRQQSCHRRGRRPPGGGARLRLVRRESPLGRGGRTGSRARAEEQYLSQRRQSRDGLRLPRLRCRAGGGCGGRGKLGRPSPVGQISGTSCTHVRRRRGDGGCEAPRSAPRRRGQREGSRPRSSDRRALVRPSRHRRGPVRLARLVADGGADDDQHPPGVHGWPSSRARVPDRRPSHYADAGLTFLRSSPADGEEIWCRCDAGPHGFLSIAAHAHADALAVEVRYNGVDVLADPGTYCYHGEPRWRSYFRSTLAHNTIEVGGQRPVDFGRPLPLDASGPEQVDRAGDAPEDGKSSPGPQSTTATDRSPLLCATADRCGWPADFGDSRSSTVSRRRETTISGWRSTSDPTSRLG